MNKIGKMTTDASRTLLDLAEEQTKLLQRAQGQPEKGIVSTQVLGLIIVLETCLEKLEELERRGKEKSKKITWFFHCPICRHMVEKNADRLITLAQYENKQCWHIKCLKLEIERRKDVTR